MDEALESPGVPDTERRFRVVVLVAAIPYVVFVLPHLALLSLATTYRQMYADLGGDIPALSALAVSPLGSTMLVVVLIAMDIGIFWLMYRLAKRYWIGLVFAPIFYAMAANMAVGWLMFIPMFQVVTLVQ